jgi:hypothetical protein
VQNAEQTTSTLWSRLNERVVHRPIDELYKAYHEGQFKDFTVDKSDIELYNFVEQTKDTGPRFYDYPSDKTAYFEKRIYELRKDNSNNPT